MSMYFGNSTENHDQKAAAKARADTVYQQYGERAPEPLSYETPRQYRTRLAGRLQQHSPRCRAIRLDNIDGPVFDEVERVIYEEASARAGAENAAAGRLIPIQNRDDAGRKVTRFEGDPMAWLGAFIQPRQTVKIRRPTFHNNVSSTLKV